LINPQRTERTVEHDILLVKKIRRRAEAHGRGIVAAPFVLAGFAVSLALTRFPGSVGALYAADLAGAATGCVAVIAVLTVTDGPGAVMVVALLGTVAAALLAIDAKALKVLRAALICCILFGLLAEIQAFSSNGQYPLIRIIWTTRAIEGATIYERWNSFSRVRVYGVPRPVTPFGWGLSPTYPQGRTIRQLGLNIDSGAFTVITAFHGDF